MQKQRNRNVSACQVNKGLKGLKIIIQVVIMHLQVSLKLAKFLNFKPSGSLDLTKIES